MTDKYLVSGAKISSLLAKLFLFTGLFANSSANSAILTDPNGLSSPGTLIDFDGPYIPQDGDVIDTQYAHLGVTFGPNTTFEQWGGNTWGSRSGLHSLLYNAGTDLATPFVVHFDKPVQEAAVFFLSEFSATVTALWNGQVVETYESFASEECCHMGFTNIVFNELQVLDNAGDLGNFGIIDDLEFTNAVPVPPPLWLFSSGLLGLVGIARRKKAA